ncbi:2,5-didehydrogluconate reductase DkgB [Vibrio superstes]|uniref:2,5-diketo-D-gluconate reductase B n=1 Tax=Vibrio superstes NBRC 103154 TaxID=1219062 RepID=A0A511QUQ1_9VIBR|nr:2,5-didehydrogluconate reductase DkgB [Vibrio superstes]GEM80282.1 2,5-diketo-D-gluconate reductase B [Vibrio superstes NBRC 103154]
MKSIPLLGAGTYRLKDGAGYDSVKTSLEAGYRHIDTAQIYGNEEEVGQAIFDSPVPREEIFLTTKIWMDKYSKSTFAPSITESLEKLKTDYIDLLLIHWPLKDDEVEMEEYLPELKAVKDAGLVRHIGVSNFTNAQLEKAIDILGDGEIFTNQVEVHPYLQNHKVVDFCQANGVIVTGYMPFAYGDVLKDETIQAIAKDHDATPAQVVLAWMRQNEFVTIPSSTKKANIESNLESEKVTLSESDMERIAKLDRGHRLASPSFAPDWD